jgi:hypothetical protein
MKIIKSNLRQEFFLLVLYILLFPFMFVFVSAELERETVLFILLVTGLNLFAAIISAVLIWIVKRFGNYDLVELLFVLFPLFVSNLLFALIFRESSVIYIRNFLLANILVLGVVYGFSIFQKLRKAK